ncbi:uncharacterized protein LOC126901198 [Daktulosphaira vitifoliae]|uniref:uncharacterized protein LOC126901198 n=1 Tax=Daktulosphaira vitifoliae TaxID=58002 RepID=UPI0021AA9B9C|nr:uncharacterized protein LOC126901198 [Daktulosphaira vitifoliae]
MSEFDDVKFYSSISDISQTDSDISFQEIPKILNASSPSSICSTKPLEWDSGADVGYGLIPNAQSKELSTIERMAVNNFMLNANSTPIDFNSQNIVRLKSNSLSNLVNLEFSNNYKSMSCDQLKWDSDKAKLNTLTKNKSPMTSSFSLSTVVKKMNCSDTEKNLVTNVNSTVVSKQDENVEKTNISSKNESKSCESGKTSNSTIGSVVSSGSWEVKECCDSTNTTTDRVNSFEYLPGNTFHYSKQTNENKEIQESVQLLIEAMKQNGLTEKSKIKEVFREIYKNILGSKNSLPKKNLCDSNLCEIQDITPQTSNTGNTVLNNEIDNYSSTMTFTSPITSSQYGEGIDTSKYCDTTSLESGRHLNLHKSKLKKSTPTKHSETKIKNNSSDASKQYDKQVLKFQENFMKMQCDNQLSIIKNEIKHLNNLNKFLNTHKELKKNWNNYKEKPKISSKPIFRKQIIQNINTLNSTQTETTTSYLNSSKSNSTETESSCTACHHMYCKKGVLVHNSKSKSVKLKTGQLKDDKKPSFLGAGTYTVYKPFRTTNIDPKHSITYEIIFKPNQKDNLDNCKSKFMSNDQINSMKKKKILKSVSQLNTKIPVSSTSTLQEYLVANRPDYIARTQQRQNILNELQKLREKRKQPKKDYLLMNSEDVIPPNPLTIKRIMTQKEMRKQTENKYRLCSEVKNKKIEKKRKEEYMTNKIMANIFNKKLQKKTLKGNVDLSNSVSVCSL